MEELLQRPVLARQELDVIDQQHVHVAVRGLEAGAFVVPDGVDEVVGELLGVHVADPDAAVEPAGIVADRVQQVGLAQARIAVDEQRVVGLGGRFGHGHGGGVGEAVRRTDHEGIEDVLRVQPAELVRGAGQHGLRLLLDQLVGSEGRLDDGFRLCVDGNQIGVHVDGAADVLGEDVVQGIVQGVLDLGLQDFAGEFVGNGHQEGGTDQALGLGEDDETALPG